LEFRPSEQPVLYAGNITYYLEKSAEDEAAKKGQPKLASLAPAGANGASSSRQSVPGVNRKEQRRIEAEQREMKSKVLKPLEAEFEALEAKIAELEGAQATLSQRLSSEELANDASKMREASNAADKIAKSLETSYYRWGQLSDEIEKVKAKLGVTA
jgi:ATP-binding cassette subfamily F protein 3